MTHEDLQSDETTQETAAQAAVYAEYEFKGQKLNPFTEGRRAAAQALGLKILNGNVNMEDGNLYQGALWDCHIIIWLCLSDRSKVVKSHRFPDKTLETIAEWADENIQPSDYSKELETVGAILTDTFKNKAVPMDSGNPAPPSHLGKGSRPRRQRS